MGRAPFRARFFGAEKGKENHPQPLHEVVKGSHSVRATPPPVTRHPELVYLWLPFGSGSTPQPEPLPWMPG